MQRQVQRHGCQIFSLHSAMCPAMRPALHSAMHSDMRPVQMFKSRLSTFATADQIADLKAQIVTLESKLASHWVDSELEIKKLKKQVQEDTKRIRALEVFRKQIEVEKAAESKLAFQKAN